MKWHVIFFFIVLICIGILDTEATCKKGFKRRGRGKRAAEEQKRAERIDGRYKEDQGNIEYEDMTVVPETH